MKFKKAAGFKGMIFVPETKPCATKKHPCKDCFSCQMCGDERCRACRGFKKCHAKKVTKKE